MKKLKQIYNLFENFFRQIIDKQFIDKDISLFDLIKNSLKILFVVIPISLGIILFFFYQKINDNYNKLYDNYLSILEVSFSENLKLAMNTNDFIQVRNSLQKIRELKSIEDVLLVDNYNKIIISDDLKKEGDVLQSTELSKIFKNESYENAYRFDNKLVLIFKNETRCQSCHLNAENVLGGLVVSFNAFEWIDNKLIYFIILILLGIIIVITSYIFFKVITQSYLIDPLNSLAQVYNNISHGNSIQNIQIKSPKEFKYLFDVLFKLAEEIDVYIEEIKLKNSEKEQIKVLAGIGEMAAKVAHEVRNPLNTIDGAIRYLRRISNNNADQTEYLDLIEENIHRINNVASELLHATRPAKPVLEKINVVRLLQDRIQEFSRRINNSAIVMYFEAMGEIPIIFVDQNQIIQVIDNLLENSINACEDKGSGLINIHLKKISQTPMQNFLLLRFVDNGNGIPSENLINVFQPFFTTKSNGTGLGLSIVENIVKNHRGQIKIFSKVNKGTFVKILLPLRT